MGVPPAFTARVYFTFVKSAITKPASHLGWTVAQEHLGGIEAVKKGAERKKLKGENGCESVQKQNSRIH